MDNDEFDRIIKGLQANPNHNKSDKRILAAAEKYANPVFVEKRLRSLREKTSSEVWLKKTANKNKKLAMDKEWLEKNNATLKATMETEEWKLAQLNGVRKRSSSKEWIANQKDGARKRSENLKTDPEAMKRRKQAVTKFIVIGTCMTTGNEITLVGNQAMEEAGFQPQLIGKCIKGERNHHKGYTWRREEIKKGQ